MSDEQLTREQVHAKIDEMFDELMRLSTEKRPLHPQRLMLMVREDGTAEGCILVHRGGDDSFITWGISPHSSGLHSGHYDMTFAGALEDWRSRVNRGW